MRAMTERRRRKAQPKEDGKLMLFFGARTPDELPYFGPLTRLPKEFIDINFAFSRIPAQPRQYVQDLIRSRADEVVGLLRSENTYLYLCGLKGMEKGVDEAFTDICGRNGLEWKALQAQLLQNGRYHVETY
jgi:benzoyl-CoA 2,3-dioxygenase component A